MSGVTLGGSPSLHGSGYGPMRTTPVQATGFWGCINRGVSFITDAIRAPVIWLACVIAKKFFLPLTAKEKQVQLRKEETFHTKYLKGEPVPPLQNKKILNAYKEPEARSYVVRLEDGRKITLTCSIWETKPREGGEHVNGPYYNLVYGGGNHATNESTFAGVYPYLHAMLGRLDKQEHFKGARAFVITAYNITNENAELHIPDPFHNGGFIAEEGLIIKKALCAIQEDYQCEINQLIVHSLCGILFGGAMMQFTENDQRYIPKSILFDRCPWSIEKAAKNVAFGWLIVPIAKCLGLTLDIGDQVNRFYNRHKRYIEENQISFFVIDVEQDHRFSNVQLGVSGRIKQLVGTGVVTRLFFDFPQQLFPEGAHHSMSHIFFYGAYLKEENYENTETFVTRGKRKFLGNTKTLSAAIVRQSMRKAETIYEEKMKQVVA